MDWIIFDVSLVAFIALIISLMIAPERRAAATTMTKVAAAAS